MEKHFFDRKIRGAIFPTIPCLLLLSLRLVAADIPVPAEWSYWRGPGYNGITSEALGRTAWPQGEPAKCWQVSIHPGYTPLVISENRIYTLGNREEQDLVSCLDCLSGQVIWQYAYPEPYDSRNFAGGPFAPPTVDGNRLYTVSRRGNLFCFDKTKGTILWSKKLLEDFRLELPEWGFTGAPLVLNELLILNAGTAGMALNKETGELVWLTGTKLAGYSPPVPFLWKESIYLAVFTAESLAVVNSNDGKILWEYPWKTPYKVNVADPIVTGDKIFISSGYGKGCALLQMTDSNPQVLWQHKKMRNHFTTSVLWNGCIYGFDGNIPGGDPSYTSSNIFFRCLDVQTGEVLWSDQSLGVGSVIITDGKLLILTDKGELVIAPTSRESFQPISCTKILEPVCWTPPVLFHGRLYARNHLGDLVCLDVSRSVTAPGAKLEKLIDNRFGFSEGPVFDGDNTYYFTDFRNNLIYTWTLDGQLSVFRENSGGANGLAFDSQGNLLVCEMASGRLVSLDQQGNLTVLAETYNNARLNSPNDLWLDPKGGIYFTDPRYGREDGYQQDRQGVYYLSPDRSRLIRVNDEMDVPNGIIGSPDGRYLYVADSGKNETFVFDIKKDGTLSGKRLFAPEGIDGMTVDYEGNIYITTSHIHVYDPTGKKIQTIEVPEQPGNICFGGKDKKTLFITGTTSLYSIQMQVSGF
jgi:outer membrane protein assembly factor BamB